MQFPSANNDLLILAPSIILRPRLLVFDARSLPAKSMRLSFPVLISASIPASRSLCSTLIQSTAWDLDDVSFAPVASQVLCWLPYIRSSKISSGVLTSISETPAIQTPLTGSSLRSSTSEETITRSRIYSLQISMKLTFIVYSRSYLSGAILVKSSLRVKNMLPGFYSVPNIVYVFPAPVAPYAKTVALQPLITPSHRNFVVLEKISACPVS